MPDANGGWHCGVDVQISDAAALPERETRSVPPVMLIDPARFGEGDLDVDLAVPVDDFAAAQRISSEPAAKPTAVFKTAETTEDKVATTPVEVKTTQVKTPAVDARTNGYVIQLARAESPRGFDALLAKIGPAARTSQRRQLIDGGWVLLLGNYASIASARSAIPNGISGAFARALSDFQFN